MLWHIELKFCIWLCFTVLQIKFKCRQFASIFVGVMPLLELRILKIYSFPHFSLTCFDLLSWNFAHGFVIPSQQSWRGYSNAAVRGWLGEWVGGWVRSWVRGSVPLYLVDTLATTVFAQSISNFTCTFSMMRGETLLISGHGVKGQGQLSHSVHKTLWTR